MLKTFPLDSRAKTTALKQPKELFVYARTSDGKYVYDKEGVQKKHLLYYYLPDSYVDKQFDLTQGYSKFKKIPDEENMGDFEALLKGIMDYEQKSGNKIGCDIITFRGLMTKLMLLPYNLTEPLDLYVVSYDGQLFIKSDDEKELKKKSEEIEKVSPAEQDFRTRCEYSGYKFEALCTLPRPWSECDRGTIECRPQKTVNNYEQYLSMVRTGIGSVKLALAGEVDGAWDYLPREGSPLGHYVELKTSRAIMSPGQLPGFEKKLLKTWAQCFLIGIKRVVYGFRDDDLILRNVELYNTEEIPILLKDSVSDRPKINCTNALKWYGAVIQWLATSIPRNEFKLWKLNYDPGSHIFSVSEAMSEDFLKNSIITSEFRQWRLSLATAAKASST